MTRSLWGRSAIAVLAATVVAPLATLAPAAAGPAPQTPAPATSRALGPSGLPDPPGDVPAVTLPDQPRSPVISGGALWAAMGSSIGRLVPGQGLQVFPLPVGKSALTVAADASGTIWFGGFDGLLGTINSNGVVSLKTSPRPGGRIATLTLGLDDRLWATTTDANASNLRIERLDATGASTWFALDGFLASGQLLAAGPESVLFVEGAKVTAVAPDLTRTVIGVLPDTPEAATASSGQAWFAGGRRISHVAADGTITAQPADQLPAGTVLALSASPSTPVYALIGSPQDGPLLARAAGTMPAGVTALPWFSGNGFARQGLNLDPAGSRLWITVSELGGGRMVPVDPNQISSTVTVAPPTQAISGVRATFNATAHDFDGNPRTGRIVFYNGNQLLGAAGLDANGAARLSVAVHGYGGADIVASYERVAGTSSALSPRRTMPLDQASTVTTLSAPPSPWRPGQSVTVTVTVTSPNGNPPTGTVTVLNQTLSIVAGAPAKLTFQPLPYHYSLHAEFQGGQDWDPSQSGYASRVARWDDPQENYVEGTYVQLFRRVAASGSRVDYARRLRTGMTRTQFANDLVATRTYRLEALRSFGLVSPNATLTDPMVAKAATTPIRVLDAQRWGAQAAITSCRATGPPLMRPGGTFDCWLNSLYNSYVGRTYTPAERAAALKNNSVAGRTATAASVITSTTALERFVTNEYRRFGRPLSSAGRADWVKRLRIGNYPSLTAALIATPEWFNRTQL